MMLSCFELESSSVTKIHIDVAAAAVVAIVSDGECVVEAQGAEERNLQP